jgi:hypothetical protein
MNKQVIVIDSFEKEAIVTENPELFLKAMVLRQLKKGVEFYSDDGEEIDRNNIDRNIILDDFSAIDSQGQPVFQGFLVVTREREGTDGICLATDGREEFAFPWPIALDKDIPAKGDPVVYKTTGVALNKPIKGTQEIWEPIEGDAA